MRISILPSLRRLAAGGAAFVALHVSAEVAPFQTPVSYEQADERAGQLLAKMSTEQKLQLIAGYNNFYLRGFPELGIPQLYMSDATQGVNIRPQVNKDLEKSVAFPAPILLASTWNPELTYRYARAVGEECRAGGIAVLLGPGLNIYRQSQNGRNFEYFGEDPFLVARLIERYVRGILDTGTMPTLKHFLANNTDYHRRTSNSIVDERTQHEIYLPGFKAGIDAGAMAVMTSYNQLNGEWCGQSHYVITELLRGKLGYRWMVMSDWWSIWDPVKVIKSGLDLDMPGTKQNGERFMDVEGARVLKEGKVTVAEIDRMVRTILRTCIALGLHDRPIKDAQFLAKFPEHEEIALETARQGIVLLKNDGVLPLAKEGKGRILVTGLFVEKLARGGGAANVEGYDIVSMKQALADMYGDRVEFVERPTDEQLKSAAVVILSTGTFDHEGWDRPFELSHEEENRIQHTLATAAKTIVVVNSGSGIRMTGWNDRAAAVVYAWYPGQNGNRALAEILAGVTNPSGRLPMTIEREFSDSPAYGYIPKGEKLYTGWKEDGDMTHPVYPVEYKEGVFVGYRWYEKKKIAPLYAFGSGLSYTTFELGRPRVSSTRVKRGEGVTVRCAVANSGQVSGVATIQVYVRPLNAPVERPEKELKGFGKIKLTPGEFGDVVVPLRPEAFAYYDINRHDWTVAPGEYEVLFGTASDKIAVKTKVTIE